MDNSQSKYFPPIKSQGSVGSCVAWAETYYQFSYTQNKKLNRTATYENSFSPLWTYNFTNFSDDIGSYDSATYSVYYRKVYFCSILVVKSSKTYYN